MSAPRIAVIGGGLMGAGLARLFTRLEWPVCVYDPSEQARDTVLAEAPRAQAVTRLEDAAAAADLVIEAAPERLDVKQSIFATLASAAPAGIPLATNSSVIPVGDIARLLPDEVAARVIGMHFWNPPDVIPLVEVIQGPRTALAPVEAAIGLLRRAGREPVHVRKDTVPGNRMQHALWREAMALVDEGVCTPEEVDRIVKNSFGLRLAVLGPLENADLVGLDLTEQIHRVVLPVLSRRQTPAESLLACRALGADGVRTGCGFYSGWTAESVSALRARLTAHLRLILEGRKGKESSFF
jgi:3-hydroxybutyryl-CoA dehydrogenase